MSRHSPAITGRQLLRALQRAGLVVLRQKGSHVSLEKRKGKLDRGAKSQGLNQKTATKKLASSRNLIWANWIEGPTLVNDALSSLIPRLGSLSMSMSPNSMSFPHFPGAQ